MPRIPAYQPQVQAQRTQGGLLSPNAPAGAFGEGLAQGVQNASNQIGAIAKQAIEEVNQTRYTDAMNKVFSTDEELETEAKKLQGDKFIQVGPKKFLDDRTARVQDIVKDLPEPVKVRVLQASDRAGIAFRSNLDNHLLGQTEYVKKTNGAAAEQAALTYAESHPEDTAGIESRLGLALAAADTLNAGMEPEARTQASKAMLANVLVRQTAGMLKENPTGAKEFFDKNAEAMSASVHFSGLKAMVTHSSEAQWVQDNAQGIAGSGMDLAQQLETVDTLAKDNPERLTALRAEVTQRFNLNKAAQAAVLQEAEGHIWGAVFPVNGRGGMSISKSITAFPAAWAALGGEGSAKLKAQLEAYGKRNENDPALQIQQHLAYFRLINDPEFPKLNENQIKAKLGELGPQLTIQVMNDLQKLRTTPAKIQEVEIDKDILMNAARKVGLVKDGLNLGKLTGSEQATLGNLTAQMKKIQQASGQKWTYESSEELARQLATKVVTERHWYGDKDQPFFEVQASEAIPEAFTRRIKAESQAAGQPVPTGARLYQLWYDAKDKGLVDAKGNLK